MYWRCLLWQQYLFSGDEDVPLRRWRPRLLTSFLEWMKKYQDPDHQAGADPLGWRISDYAGGNLTNGG